MTVHEQVTAQQQFDSVVVVGAGGHGREVAEILDHAHRTAGGPRCAGFIDDDEQLWGQKLDGRLVLGGWDLLNQADRQQVGVVVAVGRPELTRMLIDRALDGGLRLATAVSPLANVSPHATLEPGAILFPHVSVHTQAQVGMGVTLNVGSSVSHDSRIGRYAIVGPGARLAGNVLVGEGASMGMMAAVIQGVEVGPWTVVGAGAVVIRDLPSHVTAVGVPARILENS